MPAVRQDMVSPQTGDAEDLSDLQDYLLEHAKEEGPITMKKLWLLFLLVIPYQLIHAQEVKHAPTVEQCRADQRLWFAEIEQNPRLSEPYATVSQWINEMYDCEKVDPENALRYENTVSEATTTLLYRAEQLLKRRGLWQQYLDEVAGKQ